MLTRRGAAVLGAGASMWLAARLTGSSDLHIVAVGVVLLPLLAVVVTRWHRHRVRAARRLSARRVFAGSKVRVDLDVRNPSRVPSSVLLLEDHLPAGLGRAARAVLTGLKPRTAQTVSYTVTCARRGRYEIGPLMASFADPFGLARRQLQFPHLHELIVYPEVEDLRRAARPRSAGGSGESAARQLFRRGEDFYTMRQYQIGDDLRRIHWPSTARTGRLMIRQDEAGRRASATVFLDSRRVAFAGDRPFERAVSAAASIGNLAVREAVGLRLAGIDLPPRAVSADAFLETLAVLSPSDRRSLGPSLRALRDRSAEGSTLIIVTRLPTREEQSQILAASAGYGAKLAVIVDPAVSDPNDDPVRKARLALARGGWQTVLLPPDRRLQEVWTERPARPMATAARS